MVSQIYFMPHPPMIISEIGGGRERAIKQTIDGMRTLASCIAEVKPETIVFITPHGNSFSNGTCLLYEKELTGDFSEFGYPDIIFNKTLNIELTEDINEELEAQGFTTVLMDKATANAYKVKVKLDHAVMVPMHFIDDEYNKYDIVHITPGFTDLDENYAIGSCIFKVIQEKGINAVIVCSGDLSHALLDNGPYEFHQDGVEFDKIVKESIMQKDAMKLLRLKPNFIKNAAQCGLRSFLMGFGAFDGYSYASEVLSYEGPFGVGYLTGRLVKKEEEIPSLMEDIKEHQLEEYNRLINKEDEYIKLARRTIEHYVRTGRRPDLNDTSANFSDEFINEVTNKRAGTFVSIHKNGQLRGCMGTISATCNNLLEEIVYNAITACSKDPRFDEVTEEELSKLEINVDVLSEKEEISSKDMLDVKRYGVIVEKGKNRGLLLPNLEGINTVEEQISIAMKKAGIDDEKGMKLYRFEVIRHEVDLNE